MMSALQMLAHYHLVMQLCTLFCELIIPISIIPIIREISSWSLHLIFSSIPLEQDVQVAQLTPRGREQRFSSPPTFAAALTYQSIDRRTTNSQSGDKISVPLGVHKPRGA